MLSYRMERILHIICCILGILCALLIFGGLSQLEVFDGYYQSIEEVMLHEKSVKEGAIHVASIKKGEYSIEIMSLNNSLKFYTFKSKDSTSGKRFAVASSETVVIDYGQVQQGQTKWRRFKENWFATDENEKDLFWCVSMESIDNSENSNLVSYEYTHSGQKYYLLTTFERASDIF